MEKEELKTLEDVLQLLGSKKPFLKKIQKTADSVNPFTVSGSKSYSKLIEILYAVGTLTGSDVENIVETLDNIAGQ